MLKQRMYHLVLYNISPIQQAIQSYHAGMEYALKYWDMEEFKQWSIYDKTVIILNGGTSNKSGLGEYDVPPFRSGYGSMEKHYDELFKNKVLFTCFFEPDLNNATTAIAFLCDETIWDKEKYPDPDIFNPRIPAQFELYKAELERMYGEKTAFLRIFLSSFRMA